MLSCIQQWFAGIITGPIDADSRMQLPPGVEVEKIILPSKTLSAKQRIEMYNQQYWWRLLSVLHQNFPLLTRLFGYADFNLSMGMPFLTRYPSRSWSLARLGEQLPMWIEEHYTALDKQLVLLSAELDWAYQDLFFAPPPLRQESSLALMSKKMRLQRHIKLFSLPFDLFSFRKELLAQKVGFWTTADFPSLVREEGLFFLLYRNRRNRMVHRKIGEGQWTFFHLIEQGNSIEQACKELEKKGAILYEEACLSLHKWVQEGIEEKWVIEFDR